MKTRTRWFSALALVMALAVPGPAQAQTYFWWQVVDERGEAYTGQNVQCSVFRPNQHAAAVIHTSSALTSGGASPLFSDVNGRVHFYASFSDPVDVTCYYAHGGSAQVNRLDRFTHKIVIPRQQGLRVSRFSVTNATAATNQAAGITLPAGAVVRDVVIQNLAPRGVGTYHVSVGFAGNHAVAANVNALVNTQALTSPDEWIRPHASVMTAGGNVASHRGVALEYHVSGYRVERPYMVHVASGLDVTYAVDPGTTAGARVHVYIIWSQYHTGINRLGLTD